MAAQPFLPFTKPEFDEPTIAAVVEVLRSGWVTSGPKVLEFEAALSAYFGGRPVRTFSSGTATLEVALRVAGVGPGDEVITSPLSWVATANVILAVGATPVFVDVDPATRNLDLDLVERALTSRTRAIIPVHLAGLPVDMDRLYALAAAAGLRVVEDAAQAIGSRWQGRRVGSFGDLVSFSFQATKNVTTGEGGCLVLNDEAEARLAGKLRLQGLTRSGADGFEVDVLGGKSNMTDLAAAIGLAQLAKADAIAAKRRRLARRYLTAFAGGDGAAAFERTYGAQLPPPPCDDCTTTPGAACGCEYEDATTAGAEGGETPGGGSSTSTSTSTSRSNCHLFQLVLPPRVGRATFIQQMRERHQIGVGVHYPAIHLFQLYRARGFGDGMFPVAERVGRQIVTLPLFNSMTDADVDRVADAVKALLGPATPLTG
ncbi:hypothetical protein GGTG_00721 [Gaeumannomyces tritici R3-111a-1]|uniref:UDP-4-amino-4-deoxy-L-arabinose-oxoglutarate aminotransferase n=1 Tax=Gaeumannomyces tritici (strain R3-111a-1) TaxID=644352 RepID=J3NHI4_GAET3|nr:hypothetical protein GGTG_00721 [Gaeumannomyces tritici R3-111a-1]EJT80727.1 hypothetical protein GGTG_00721 [Gaeumannomyces tritici R3-111a-1]